MRRCPEGSKHQQSPIRKLSNLGAGNLNPKQLEPYVCVYIYIHICMYINYIYIYIHIYKYKYIYIYLSIYLSIYIYTRVCMVTLFNCLTKSSRGRPDRQGHGGRVKVMFEIVLRV